LESIVRQNISNFDYLQMLLHYLHTHSFNNRGTDQAASIVHQTRAPRACNLPLIINNEFTWRHH
jgi:hypothetical protein